MTAQQVHYNAIRWVKKELDQTLAEARTELDALIETPEDMTHLQQLRTMFRQVQGVLEMVEIQGGVLLLDELRALLKVYAEGEVRNRNEALEVIMRAIVQLPDYLDYIQRGNADVPIVLLPLLNDLRTSRDASLLSDKILTLPDVDEDQQALVDLPSVKEDLQTIAKALRPLLQLSLLGWFKNQSVDRNLLKIAAVFHRLVMASKKPESKRLWWISQAVTEALQCHGLESSVTAKALFGKIDRQLKILINFGEDHFADQIPLDLIKNLLFYVASANSGNTTVNAVKAVYRLNSPAGEGSLELARASMSGPNQDMYESIANALLEDITEIKERLEVYTLADDADKEHLDAMIQLFLRLGDTLSMLGLSRLRENMSTEARMLKMAMRGNGNMPSEQLQGIAEALMDAEMEVRAFAADRRVPERVKLQTEGAGSDLAALPDHEYQKVLSAVIHESLIIISHCKEAILTYTAKPEELHPMMQIPALLEEINGAMVMLPLDSVLPLIQGLQGYIDTFINQQHTPDDDELNALADTIVSIEFYLESLQAGKGDHQLILERGEESLDLLRKKLPVSEELSELIDGDEYEPELPDGTEEMLVLPESVGLKKNDVTPDVKDDESPEDQTDILTDLDVLPAEIDEEIHEIFKEEAAEEIERISETLPQWLDEPSATEPLSIIRRSFHTLKGSGRLVGAQVMGEFSWSYEDLLNRVIDGTLQPTTAVTSAMKSAVELLPGLLDGLQTGARPVPDVAKQMKIAEALIKGENLKEPSNETLMMTAAIVVPDNLEDDEDSWDEQEEKEAQATEVDAEVELFDIFRSESGEYLGIIDEYLSRTKERSTPAKSDEELYRALHTLNGSARTADVEAIYAPCAVAEIYTGNCDKADTVFNEEFPGLLGELTQHVRDTLSALEAGQDVEKPEALIQRLESLVEESQQQLQAVESAREFEETAVVQEDDEPEELGASTNLVEVAAELEAELDAVIDQGEIDASETASLQGVDDYDEELAEIFLEEAGELLDSSENAMSSWKDEPADLMPVKELQRHLHTLKGGARMAGITPIGDLSHVMESLFLAVVENKVEAGDEVFASLHNAFDQLHKMTRTAHAKEPVLAASELVEELENFIQGKPREESDQEEEQPQANEAVAEDSYEQDVLSVDEPVAETPAAKAEISEPEAPEVELVVEENIIEAVPQAEPEPAPVVKKSASAPIQQELVRVRSDLLDELVNHAGEVNIFHSRVEEQVVGLGSDLQELDQTIGRLANQLRSLEGEAEAQILSQIQRDEPLDLEGSLAGQDFDPLELDRYSKIQQLSRSLAESINDLTSIQNLLTDAVRDTETLLVQQSRISTGLQDGLMRTRMVPFTTMLPRLRRIVRQTAANLGKKVEFKISGESSELDRKLLDSMVVPLEHMLRNAIAHGIETPDMRKQAGKTKTGHINVKVTRESNEVVILIEDDGAGIAVDELRAKAIEKGLISDAEHLTDKDIMQFILESGLSTANEVSQVAGRGVGMDIVNTEIKQLNGQLSIDSSPGTGTSFRVTLPFTLAINQALLVQSDDELYAIPMNSVEGVVRVSGEEVLAQIDTGDQVVEYAGRDYELMQLSSVLHQHEAHIDSNDAVLPVLLLRSGDHRIALLVSEVLGNREVVIKPLGTLLSKLASVSGATILGDGKVVLVLDVAGLIRASAVGSAELAPALEQADVKRQQTIMVVDDSITIRKVTTRMLERHNYHVVTAKDGVDAVSKLQETTPDLMLLDIEMPRMDGYELAGHIRNQKEIKDLPIIMITSRTGRKHKDRAMSLGVNQYLGKPYQEGELMGNITALLAG